MAGKSLKEAQLGVIFAGYLKLLMPLLVVIPGIERPHSTPSFALTVARGDEAREIPNGIQFFEVNFDLPDAGMGKLDGYDMDVEGAGGKKLFAGLPVYTPPPPQTLVSLHCAALIKSLPWSRIRHLDPSPFSSPMVRGAGDSLRRVQGKA